MAKKLKPVPRWIMAHAEKCKSAFGLWDWHIVLRSVKRIPNPRKDGRVLGQADVMAQYLEANIQLDQRLTDDGYGHKVVTREFLHVALGDLDMAFRHVLPFIPKKYRNYCDGLYDLAKEHTIEKIAKGMTPMLMAAKDTEEQ